MNFDLSEEQQVVVDLARQIFAGGTTVERLKEIERSTERFDAVLWKQLADANVLGLCLPVEHGGSGLGMVEACLMLIEQGRHLGPVPLLPTTVGAMSIAEFGSAAQQAEWLPAVVSGDAIICPALAEVGANDLTKPVTRASRQSETWRLDGYKPVVSGAQHAAALLVSATDTSGEVGLYIVRRGAAGLSVDPEDTTDHQAAGTVTLHDAEAERLGDGSVPGEIIIAWLIARELVGLCAIQVGVGEAATEQTAAYVSSRQQFGKPLSTFQAVAHQAADAFILNQAMRSTTLRAAWLMGEGLDARSATLVAKYWAAEGGQKVVHLCQHLHGGMGADVDYPIHRYFLWGLQLESALGAGSAQLARLGELIAREA